MEFSKKLVSAIILSSGAMALESELYDLSIEQLLNIDVSVASKQKVSLADVPGAPRDNGYFLMDLNTRYNYADNFFLSFKVLNLVKRDVRVPSFQEQYYPQTIHLGAGYRF